MEDFLWVEKYRPRKVEDCILPEKLKDEVRSVVRSGDVPNLLFVGGPGVGKTTIAKAMLDEMGIDYLLINGSLEGRLIDSLRNKIQTFATTQSITGRRKVVILDEADYMPANSIQVSLRSFMETFSKNCGFILTANYKNKIIPPLQSRCSIVEFRLTEEDKVDLAEKFFKRIVAILKEENVEYDAKTVGRLIMQFYPDWRRCLNYLQKHSMSGKISADTSIEKKTDIEDLVKILKAKDFREMREWVAKNPVSDPTDMFRTLYDESYDHFAPESVPTLILLMADYQDKATRVVDQEINTTAFLAEVMSECELT